MEAFSSYTDRKYSLDGSGNTVNIEYHLYRASLPGLKPNDMSAFQNDKTKKEALAHWASIKWVHDPACPSEKHEPRSK